MDDSRLKRCRALVEELKREELLALGALVLARLLPVHDVHDTDEKPREPETEAPQFLTAREVARLLRTDERMVRDWCRAGEFPAAKLGKKWLITRDELVEWIKERQVASQRRAPARI